VGPLRHRAPVLILGPSPLCPGVLEPHLKGEGKISLLMLDDAVFSAELIANADCRHTRRKESCPHLQNLLVKTGLLRQHLELPAVGVLVYMKMSFHDAKLVVLERRPRPLGRFLVVHSGRAAGEAAPVHVAVHGSKRRLGHLPLLPAPPLLQHGLVVVVVWKVSRRSRLRNPDRSHILGIFCTRREPPVLVVRWWVAAVGKDGEDGVVITVSHVMRREKRRLLPVWSTHR
jgi:hypothetical protein